MRDAAVHALRDELARLGLDRATINELADHLEAGIDDRLVAGDELSTAITTARARLGDLAAFAREHRRVRGQFGPRPTRAIAWGIALAMLAWPLIYSAGEGHLVDHLQAHLTGFGAIRTIAILALAFRSPHAAGFVLGVAANELWLLLENCGLAGVPFDLRAITLIAISAGTVLLLLGRSHTPWRWAMAALGFVITSSSIGGTTAIVYVPIAPLLALATATVAFRLRLAFALCIALAVLVSYQSIEHVRMLVRWLGMAKLRTTPELALAGTMFAYELVTIAAVTFAAVISRRGDRTPRIVLDELRPGS